MTEEKEIWLDRHWWRNKGRLYRYFAMLNISLIGLGLFVCFDAVGAFQEALMEKFEISFSEFSLMYSVNSWPNVVLSFVGGVLIDRVFGIKWGTLIYSGIFTAGHLIFSLGVVVQTYWCALLGRFIAGIGSEFLYICMQIYSIHYFKGKELSMVMCINISISRLGSSIVYAIADPVLREIRTLNLPEDVGISIYIVGIFALLTILGAVILMFMNPKDQDLSSKETRKKEMPKLTFRDFVIFPMEFWLILVVQMSFVVSIYVFLPYTQEFFKTMYNMTVDSANSVTSFFSIIGAVIAPFVGIIIDKLGRGIVFSKLGLITGLIAHLILAFTTWSPYLSLFILSLSYSFFNGSIVPMFAFIIPEHKLGTAYGVGLAFINGGYGLTIFIAGVIVDSYSYLGLEVFMLSFIVVAGLFASVGLWIKDTMGSGILNMTPAQRQLYLAKIEEAADVKEPLNILTNK